MPIKPNWQSFMQRAPAPLDANESPDPWGLRKGKVGKGVPIDAKDITEPKP
jgi:hypothetical protein